MLEQKVWLTTSAPLFPNLYVFLLGHPGTGKTRTIRKAKEYVRDLPEFHLAPISLTWASLVDAMLRSKRAIMRMPHPPLEYNTMLIAADELGTLIHKWDKEMADGLSAFYDPDPYGQERRGGDLKVKIKSPQVNMLCGSTPSNLIETLPEGAWGQGFTSRAIMVFSDERIVGDDFAVVTRELSSELVYDLKAINMLLGEFKVTSDYRNLVNEWRGQDEQPAPTHPRLLHYNSRRRVNLYKLSMISAIDHSDVLLLTANDFHRARAWLEEAEAFMPDIFKAGAQGTDGQAMDEIKHFVQINSPVSEPKLINFCRERVPAQSVLNVLMIMERSGMIRCARLDPRTGMRTFEAPKT